MTKEEFFEKYVGNKVAVHVPTKELAYAFMEEAMKHGIDFNCRGTFLDKVIRYGSTLCLRFENNTWHWGDLLGYNNSGYTIVEYQPEPQWIKKNVLEQVLEEQYGIKRNVPFEIRYAPGRAYFFDGIHIRRYSDNCETCWATEEIITGKAEIRLIDNTSEINKLKEDLKEADLKAVEHRNKSNEYLAESERIKAEIKKLGGEVE